MKTHDAHVSEQSQRDLAAGVLRQAAQDLWRFYDRTSRVEGELYHDAYRWLTVDERSWPFSFLNVCQLLNLSPENVRRKLKSRDRGVGFAGRAAELLSLSLQFERAHAHDAFQAWRGKKHRLSQEHPAQRMLWA